MPSCMLTAILVLASTICVAHASFVAFFPPSASQCSNFTIDFTGNQILFPITFLLLPVNSSSPLVVQLPDTAFDSVSNSGTYTTPIPFSAGTQFIAVMHDALGAGNGGVSTVYTVGGSSNAGCLQQGLNNTLAFRLSPSSPPQCELQRISWTPLDPNSNGDNLNNVNITGYVPGGLAFRLNVVRDGVPTGSNTLWQTSVPQGQTFMFLYERTDPATGNVRRETSAIQNVQPSTNSSCTQGGPSVTEPLSTSHSPTPTQTTQTSGVVSPANSPDNDKGPFNLPKPALIGIIVGGVCLVLIIIPLLYLFCTRKHRKRKSSPLEDDQQTTMSNGSRAALMKIDPTAPMGISLPPVRASGFGIDSFSPYAPTPPAQGERGLSPDTARQRTLFGRMKARQDIGKVSSVASWGNKGALTQSIFELRPPPRSVPVDVMSDISEYSTPDSIPAPPSPAAIAMRRGGRGPGRQRTPVEGYYPQSDSHGGGAQSNSRKGWDDGNPSEARDRPPAQAQYYRASEYSPTEPNHDQSFMSPVAGRTPNQYYYPVQPSRANPLVQRRLSAYEGDDDYYEDGTERTGTGGAIFRLEPAGQAL